MDFGNSIIKTNNWEFLNSLIIRDNFGDFFNRLETVYNVSQVAISAICKEMRVSSERIHNYVVKHVSVKLGLGIYWLKCFFNDFKWSVNVFFWIRFSLNIWVTGKYYVS
jgi:hypothetical protein